MNKLPTFQEFLDEFPEHPLVKKYLPNWRALRPHILGDEILDHVSEHKELAALINLYQRHCSYIKHAREEMEMSNRLSKQRAVNRILNQLAWGE